MRIAAAAFVLPRMEAPFIAEWCHYLSLQGVDKLFLTIDQTPTIWAKKSRIQYYCPHLDSAGFELYWTDQLKRARERIEIEAHAIADHGRNFMHTRRKLFHALLPQLIEERFDWLLYHDVDEFLVPRKHESLAAYLRGQEAVDAVMVRQLLFESRWDPLDDYRPRRAVDIRSHHAEVIPQTKYVVRPERAVELHAHHCVLDRGLTLHEAPETLVLHHYRGIEQASHPKLKDVMEFSAKLARPLYTA